MITDEATLHKVTNNYVLPVGKTERRTSTFGMTRNVIHREPTIPQESLKYPRFAQLLATWVRSFDQDWHSNSVVFTNIKLRWTLDSGAKEQDGLVGATMIIDIEATEEGDY